jgi:AraC-like DNA-binding protein
MMQNFIQLVKNNIDNPDLKISFLCKELLVTEATLGRKVKAYTGQSVGRYITSIRMAVARQLLKESGLNISEIAYRVGYQDPNTISRYFKKDAGISPSGFRKRRKL